MYFEFGDWINTTHDMGSNSKFKKRYALTIIIFIFFLRVESPPLYCQSEFLSAPSQCGLLTCLVLRHLLVLHHNYLRHSLGLICFVLLFFLFTLLKAAWRSNIDACYLFFPSWIVISNVQLSWMLLGVASSSPYSNSWLFWVLNHWFDLVCCVCMQVYGAFIGMGLYVVQ